MATHSDHGLRDCRHGPEHRHEHGTRQAYVADRCRCEACTRANRDAENRRRRDAAYGRPTSRVDAEPTRRHMQELARAGVGINQVARLSGVPRSTLARVLWGEPSRGNKPSQRITRETAERVGAIPMCSDNRAAGALVDATGTRRRLQALIAVGWTLSAVAREMNCDPRRLRRILNAATVTRGTADGVQGVYERLNLTSPDTSTPSLIQVTSEASTRARIAGWLPPLAWDNIDTDTTPPTSANVTSEVDDIDIDIAIARVIAGQSVALTLTERDVLIDRLTRRGHSLQEISHYLDVSSRTISRRRRAINAA